MQNFNVFTWLKNIIHAITLENFNISSEVLSKIIVETPKPVRPQSGMHKTSYGELSTNAAMVIASHLKQNPRQIAITLIEKLRTYPEFAEIELAGPGFINFVLVPTIWHRVLESVLSAREHYGQTDIGNNVKVNIEYVSANPTGPMHIGHARGAIYGDALARVMEYCGFDITKEFYVNDAGNQIDILVKTARLRYVEALTNHRVEIPAGYYPGEYLVPVGQKLVEIYDNQLLNLSEQEYLPIIKPIVIECMLNQVKDDLKQLKINHDVFFSEQSLHSSGEITSAIDQLTAQGLIYNGILPAPKNADHHDNLSEESSDNQERLQPLFKSTAYGDDQDRAVQKADGSWAYFAADIAYAQNKAKRGFEYCIMVLGADHIGYDKRIRAIYSSLSNAAIKFETKFCQLVTFIEDGEPVKMSKRAGSFTTIRDVINAVDPDVIRFMMLTRKNDVPLDFDLNLVQQQSRENPVFYVQYGQVRANSVIENCQNHFLAAYQEYKELAYDLALLTTIPELNLIKQLALWPMVVEKSGSTGEIHRITHYLVELASQFHAFWNLGKGTADLRFIVYENLPLTTARIAIVDATKLIIREGLRLLGITPLERM